MQTISLKTDGVNCPSCLMLIEMNVSDLPGVGSVRAWYAEGLTTVTYDPRITAAHKIVARIKVIGRDLAKREFAAAGVHTDYEI